MKTIFRIFKENLRLLIGGFVFLFIALLIITFVMSKQTTKIIVNDKTLNVKIAKSEKDKQIGLSKTNKIAENQGMLFIFDDSDFHSFWMKNMKFPIDIIYIKGDKVTTVIENAKPSTSSDENLEIFQPDEASDKVLEVNAGIAKKYNIKKGTIIKTGSL